MRLRVTVVRRKSARPQVSAAIGQLCFEYAARARTQDYADARGAVALAGLRGGPGKAIELDSELRQPVVAAVESAKVGPDPDVVQLTHPSDIGIELDSLEVATRQARASFTHRFRNRGRPRPKAVHDGIAADAKRLHAGILTADRRVYLRLSAAAYWFWRPLLAVNRTLANGVPSLIGSASTVKPRSASSAIH